MEASIKIDEPTAGARTNATGGRSLSAFILSPWTLAIIASAIALVALGILTYAYREQIAGTLGSAIEPVLWAVGLGIAPLGAWFIALAACALKRPSMLRHPRWWAASLAFALAAVVAMSAFRTSYGSALDPMTNGGEVSLGGALATRATLDSPWVAGLEAAALTALALAIIAPQLTRTCAVRTGRALARSWAYAYPVILAGTAAAGRGLMTLSSAVARGAWSGLCAAASASAQRAQAWGRREGSASKDTADAEEEDFPDDYSSDQDDPEDRMDDYLEPASVFGTIPDTDRSLETEEDREQIPVFAAAGRDEDLFGEEGPVPDLPNGYQDQSGFESGEMGAGGDGAPGLGTEVVTATALLEPKVAATAPPTNGIKVNRFWSEEGDSPAAYEPSVAAPDMDPLAAAQIAEETAAASREMPILDRWASKWKLPSLSMLVDLPVKGITPEEMNDTSVKIRKTLADYGVEVDVKMTQPGPAVTMYGLEPGWVRRYKQESATDEHGKPVLNEAGRQVRKRVETKTRVKVDAILQREKDLALALQTASMRIESPIVGTSLVGLEVPNSEPELVTLRYVMKSPEFRKLRKQGALPIALGKGSGGDTAVLDMAKLPHLLVAGATGSGKSVCLNTIVSCLTMERSPSELRMLLIDPKRVELTPYNGIPHLLTPVVVETEKVVPLLKGLINEMFKRYRHLENEGVRNISSYNAKAKEKMPYLVLIVDELADLMMTSSLEVEQSLCRLAQLGRATGIHLVIATQRPSVDVLTGLIKANFPSRIAFGVTSQIDSRTILDTAGADKLLGRGDMLYQPIDASRPRRVQGVFISDDEVRTLVDYWKVTKWAPLPEMGLEVPEDGDEAGSDRAASTGDDLMDRAIELAQKQRKLSTSLLQRRLRIGYPRAARLMDELEEQGIVGPSDGSKSRDVIID